MHLATAQNCAVGQISAIENKERGSDITSGAHRRHHCHAVSTPEVCNLHVLASFPPLEAAQRRATVHIFVRSRPGLIQVPDSHGVQTVLGYQPFQHSEVR
eukprot:IDg2496t1